MAVASRSPASANLVAALVSECAAVSDGQAVADTCDLVFITTPDDAIGDTAAAVHWHDTQAVVHCSGTTEIDVLHSAAHAGAQIGGFHPMQSFGDPRISARSLAGSTVTIEATESLNAVLAQIVDALGCRINRLPPGMRALYHASAGYGSQFINVLLAETAGIWREWGANEDDVIAAILPMIRGTLEAVEDAGIAGAMPGPVSRGDDRTVASHRDALAALSSDRLNFYREHCLRSVTLAESAGRITPAIAAQIRKTLDG
jgi:predicted short-subunit dehydrogenase-like oxidoreductase (DUF2520 family)